MWRRPAAVLAVALAGCGGGGGGAGGIAAPTVTVTALSGDSPYAHCGRGDAAVQRGAEVEPSLAVSPADPRRVVAAWQQDRRTTGGAVGIAVAESADGGVTWHAEPLPGGAPCGAGGLTGVSDPWLAIGPDGAAYLASLRFAARGARRPAGAGIAVHRQASTLAGLPAVWSPPVAVTAGRRVFDDKPSVTADPRRGGVAYVVWHRGGRTLLSRTEDGGLTWSRPRAIGAMRRTVGQVIYPLRGGRLLMTALTDDRRLALVAAGSDDGGRTWDGPVTFGTVGRRRRQPQDVRVRSGLFPGVAALRDGTVVALWTRRRSAIVVARSRDGGRTWTRGRVVLRRPGRVLTPTLAAAADGTLGASWTETLPGRPAGRAEVLFAASKDAGRSWRTRRLVGPFDLRRAPRAGRARFLGDYAGLAAVPGGFGVLVAVAPPVARRGRSDVVFVRVLS